jgi:electron transport complex protein RnfE
MQPPRSTHERKGRRRRGFRGGLNALNPLKGLLDKAVKSNPVFVLTLGLCPTLAVTTSIKNGLAMGGATLVVLLCSNILISLIKRAIPKEVRIACYIVVIAGFVTMVEIMMKALLPPEINKALGIFIPLIVVNCIILGRAEAFASKNRPFPSILDGIGMALGFTLALLTLATIREVLGSGTITAYIRLFGKDIGQVIHIPFLEKNPLVIMILPPGAFLTLGLLLGFFNSLKKKPNPNANTYTLAEAHIAHQARYRRFK